MASIRQARHIEGKLTSVAQRTEVQLRRSGSQTSVTYIHGNKREPTLPKISSMREMQVPDYPTSFQADGVTTRCGFSWDDAAVKCGVQCKWNADCPHGTWVTDATDGESWMDPVTEKMGMCFADMEAAFTYEGAYDINALIAGRQATGLAAFKPRAGAGSGDRQPA